jgi:(S)-mandelate dehydrogenase
MNRPQKVIVPSASVLARWRLSRARNVADLRLLARRRLPRAIFDFIDGGAEDEHTLWENCEAFRRVRLAPRALVDVSQVDTTTELLGSKIDMPLIIGPTGAVGFAWPCGDLALARVASAARIPFVLSTSASVSIEAVAERVEGRLWFQCYIFKQREFSHKLIQRALVAGYESLVLTVDFPVGGNRERDFLNDFSWPFRYTPRNLFDFARHMSWAAQILAHSAPQLSNLDGFVASKDTATIASSVGRNYDSSFDWNGLQQVRDAWPKKLLVKGIVRPDDAERLVSIGVDAVIVSNHGGRQLDGGPATLDALPAIAAAVRKRIPVLLDGGIRRGSDIVKALALGADCVLIGRPTLYGISVAGEDGAKRTIDIFRTELVRAMQLCGVRTIAQLGPDTLFPVDAHAASHAVSRIRAVPN